MADEGKHPGEGLGVAVRIHVDGACGWSIVDGWVHARVSGDNGAALLIATPYAACHLAAQLLQASAEASPGTGSSVVDPEIPQISWQHWSLT
jgi:hypothetical protein